MSKILMLRGLPGSGKSTLAKEMCSEDPNWIRVNKDDIRASKPDYIYSKEAEQEIVDIECRLAIDGLEKGYSVIVDDTNATKRHEEMWQGIADKYCVDFETLTLLTDLETCLQRNSLRETPVPEDFIRTMYNKHFKTNLYDVRYQVAVQDSLQDCIIVDIDGTLALRNGRNPYDFSKVDTDIVNEPVADILRTYINDTYVIIVSGRDERCRIATKDWLLENDIYFDDLYMRPENDTRPDEIVKREIYDKYINDNFNVKFVLDDRDKVVKMWRDLGLTCLQVYYGDF